MSRERVVVAMSGGVDSSAAAALLRAQGFEVVGVTLRLYDARGTVASVGRCCGPRDIEDARAAAATLGIPHYVLDHEEHFGRVVVDDFVAAHRQGLTPNPCVRCNEHVKFGPLLRFAGALGAPTLATGHYARLAAGPDGPELLRALDRDKDQTYFLFPVARALLGRVRFPLGALRKPEVRALARQAGLPNADKPDSQQICFVPDGDHAAFVAARGGAGRPGVVVDEAGRPLARHDGTHHFTIGQRRGVPSAAGARRFVLRVLAGSGEVVVGPRRALARTSLAVTDPRWLASTTIEGTRCQVQIRHRAAAHPARLRHEASGVRVDFDGPVEGGAPGQAAVFYDGDRVLGGGWIANDAAVSRDAEVDLTRTPAPVSAAH